MRANLKRKGLPKLLSDIEQDGTQGPSIQKAVLYIVLEDLGIVYIRKVTIYF